MFIPAFTSGTSLGASMGVSFFPYVLFFQAPIDFFANGILGTAAMNLTAQVFNVAGNLFAGLV